MAVRCLAFELKTTVSIVASDRSVRSDARSPERSVLVTTSKALVTGSDALVPSSDALVSTSFLGPSLEVSTSGTDFGNHDKP